MKLLPGGERVKAADDRAMDGTPMDVFEVVGTRFHACTHDSAVDQMERWVSAGRTPHYVCVSNVYDVRLAHRSQGIRSALGGADLVVPDGMPIVWAGRLLGHRVPGRVDGATLMRRALEVSAERGRTHFMYGGTQGLLDRLVGRLRTTIPGLRVVGTMPHPFRDLTPEEEVSTIETINASGADYLCVGIGTERQLLWMHRYHGRLRVPVIIGVGAAFAFHAGLVPRAPRWMQVSGLEWVHRLLIEPRLWRRYLLVNPPFVAQFALQYLGARMRRETA
jgi:N-acetylglucosaminyldiphosphoundecaprenol N-acetyl-beta-D-mannosaminyltransferase